MPFGPPNRPQPPWGQAYVSTAPWVLPPRTGSPLVPRCSHGAGDIRGMPHRAPLPQAPVAACQGIAVAVGFCVPCPTGRPAGLGCHSSRGDEPPVPPCPCQRCPEVTAPGVLGSKCPQPRAKPLLGLPTWGWLTPRGHIQGEGRAWGGQAPPAQFLPMGFGVWVGDAGCPQAPALRSDGHQGQSHQVWVRPRDTRSLSPAPRCHCRHPKIAGGSSSASSQGPRGGL